MNTVDDYTPRDWTPVDVSFDFDVEIRPLVQTSPLSEHMCAMESQMTRNLPEGVEPFFYDVEQVWAGMDTVYGVSDLFVATQEFVFPDGTVAREGALLFSIHRMDLAAKTRTILVENL